MKRRRLLAVGVAGSLSGVSGCSSSLEDIVGREERLEANGDWRRPEFDASATGHDADVSGPAEEPDIRWQEEAPVDSLHLPAVVVSDGTAFFAGGSTVTAVDATDGSRRWQTPVAEEQRPGGAADEHCSATVGDDYLYVGTHEGTTALTMDGETAWSHDVEVEPGYSGVYRSPAVKDDTVYFCTAREQTVHAYTTDGDELWEYELEGAIYGGPAVADDSAFVADTADGLHAISTDGEHRWTTEFEEGTASYGITPTVVDETVYVSGLGPDHEQFLGAYDVETGDEVWRNNLLPTIYGSPAVLGVDARYLVCPSFGSSYVYDLTDGSLRSAVSTDAGGAQRTVPTLAADEESGYATSHGGITKFTPHGIQEWQVSFDSAVGNVAILEDAVLVGAREGRCYALAEE